MSYSIYYGQDNHKPASTKRSLFGLIGALLVVGICATAVGWAIPQQAGKFVHALFPWTRSEVQTTFSELREDVKEGQPLSEAITAFCNEIIDNANETQ